MWMNQWEIEEAAEVNRDHPVLGPASQTLLNLMKWTNRNSDGWAYWRKPSTAAAGLQELLAKQSRAYRADEDVTATPAQLKAVLRPIKAFRTRQKADFEIVEELTVHSRNQDGYLPATVKNMREHATPGMLAYSPSTGEESSADASDYFMAGDDTVLRDENDEPMVLVIRRTVYSPVH